MNATSFSQGGALVQTGFKPKRPKQVIGFSVMAASDRTIGSTMSAAQRIFKGSKVQLGFKGKPL